MVAEEGLVLLDVENEKDVLFLFVTRSHPKIIPFHFGHPPPDLQSHVAWLKKNVPYTRTIYVMHDGSTPVGYCQCHKPIGGTVEVGFVVHPDYQGRGFGGRMIDALVHRLQAVSEIRRIELQVKYENERAIGAYSRRGFTMAAFVDDMVIMAI
jgi:RimJ/RimL family protein N-acetyltransferase